MENAAAISNGARLQGLKVLVIDDSNTIRRSAEIFLKQGGHQVALAEDGFDALAKLGDFHPDLVFCDILMPRLDGYQTCALIKKNARFAEDLKVVLTEELLRDPLVKDLVAGAGAFQQTEAPSCKPTQTVHLCAVPLLYEHARIRLRIAVDSAGHVAGLFVDGREPR